MVLFQFSCPQPCARVCLSSISPHASCGSLGSPGISEPGCPETFLVSPRIFEPGCPETSLGSPAIFEPGCPETSPGIFEPCCPETSLGSPGMQSSSFGVGFKGLGECGLASQLAVLSVGFGFNQSSERVTLPGSLQSSCFGVGFSCRTQQESRQFQ